YERKGRWVSVQNPPEAQAGGVSLNPGERFSTDVRVTLPAELTANPNALTVQWVGNGALSGLRSNEVNVAVRAEANATSPLATGEGTIVVELWPDKAPNHVANFLTLAKNGFYDGRIFHRVIP